MHVWNVRHAARWKYSDAKNRHGHHRTTLSSYIFATKACIDNRKNIKQQYLPACPHNMVNFGLLAAEICWRVWGTPANFNGFRVLAALLHGTLVVGVSQTLRRWTEGAPPILGRAAITLGIGPHSSVFLNCWVLVMGWVGLGQVKYSLGWVGLRFKKWPMSNSVRDSETRDHSFIVLCLGKFMELNFDLWLYKMFGFCNVFVYTTYASGCVMYCSRSRTWRQCSPSGGR